MMHSVVAAVFNINSHPSFLKDHQITLKLANGVFQGERQNSDIDRGARSSKNEAMDGTEVPE